MQVCSGTNKQLYGCSYYELRTLNVPFLLLYIKLVIHFLNCNSITTPNHYVANDETAPAFSNVYFQKITTKMDSIMKSCQKVWD